MLINHILVVLAGASINSYSTRAGYFESIWCLSEFTKSENDKKIKLQDAASEFKIQFTSIYTKINTEFSELAEVDVPEETIHRNIGDDSKHVSTEGGIFPADIVVGERIFFSLL